MSASCVPIAFSPSPSIRDFLRAWPDSAPLLTLCSSRHSASNSADRTSARNWSRWSIFTVASQVTWLTKSDLAHLPTDQHAHAVHSFLSHCMSDLAADPAPSSAFPSAPLRICTFSYELGRVLEPSPDPRHASHQPTPSIPQPRDQSDDPLIIINHCPAAYLHDALTDSWYLLGDPDDSPTLPLPAELVDRLKQLAPSSSDSAFSISNFRSRTGQEQYESDVAKVIDLIAAGDVFQVNLAHALQADFRGSPRALFRSLLDAAHPWFGAYLEPQLDSTSPESPASLPTILSISPELFLHFDANSRRVTTRPIKGTRPAHDSPQTLLDSDKDQAELNMIVDLMRNDLGRVCDRGSIRVDEHRVVETHAVHHTVATISGRLSDHLSLADLLIAAFPGGSITGAPKVRAMQIIEQLEPTPRSIYCGSIALLDAHHNLTASIAIRTASLCCNTLTFPVGAGIVADSDPALEWLETLEKARVLLNLSTSEPASERLIQASQISSS